MSLWCLMEFDMMVKFDGSELWMVQALVAPPRSRDECVRGDGTAALRPCPCLVIGKHAERNKESGLLPRGCCGFSDTHTQHLLNCPPLPRELICYHICFSFNPIQPPRLAWNLRPAVTMSLHQRLAHTCPPTVTNQSWNTKHGSSNLSWTPEK